MSNATETLGAGEAPTFNAQSFTTGANAAGYTITDIRIRFGGAGSNASVVLRENGSDNRPGDLVATFTNPSSLSDDNLNTFTAPAGTTVSAGTTYWVSVHEGVADDRKGLVRTASDNETGAAGWTIANGRVWRNAEDATWIGSSLVLLMSVTGHANNSAPTVANAILDLTVEVGTAFSYAFPITTFTDADTGDTLTYTATLSDDSALPSWLTFNAATRTFSGTPAAAGTVSVKVTASDGSDSVSDTFDIIAVADLPDITIAADVATATGNLDFIRYTVAREGATTAALTVPVTLVPFAGNDWNLPADRTSFDVTIAAGETSATRAAYLRDVGFDNIGFPESADMSGDLKATLGAVSGFDTTDTAVTTVIVAKPAWVIRLSEESYTFAESGGTQEITVEFVAQDARMPAPTEGFSTGFTPITFVRAFSKFGTADGGELTTLTFRTTPNCCTRRTAAAMPRPTLWSASGRSTSRSRTTP